MTEQGRVSARRFIRWYVRESNRTWCDYLTYWYVWDVLMALVERDPAPVVIVVSAVAIVYTAIMVRLAVKRYKLSRTRIYTRNDLKWRRW